MKYAAMMFGAAALLAPALMSDARAFTPPGLWDPRPMDAPVYSPASVGAAIAAAEARVNARSRGQSDRVAGVGPGGDPVQESCSLQIGSVAVPSRGLAPGQDVVANAEVRGTIIQVCR